MNCQVFRGAVEELRAIFLPNLDSRQCHRGEEAVRSDVDRLLAPSCWVASLWRVAKGGGNNIKKRGHRESKSHPQQYPRAAEAEKTRGQGEQSGAAEC